MLPISSMDVQAKLTFVVDTGETPVAASTGPGGRIEHRGAYAEHEVRIRDARATAPELDREGFLLAKAPTQVADFHARDLLPETYDPEVEALVKSVTGAHRVVVFDRTLRSEDDAEQEVKRLREPVPVAHNDYTERSGPSRLRLALQDEADALLARDFAIVQVWRPTHEPIARRPLALCDSRSVRSEDLLLTKRQHRDRVGEIYNLVHHPEQRWWWYPGMTRDEALVFKVYDSREGRARFTPHGSFTLPDPSADAPPRRSIEVRTFAFFA